MRRPGTDLRLRPLTHTAIRATPESSVAEARTTMRRRSRAPRSGDPIRTTGRVVSTGGGGSGGSCSRGGSPAGGVGGFPSAGGDGTTALAAEESRVLPASSKACTTYEYVAPGETAASVKVNAVVVPSEAPSRNTRYPVTSTSSVAASQVRVTRSVPASATSEGLLGGVVSGTVTTCTRATPAVIDSSVIEIVPSLNVWPGGNAASRISAPEPGVASIRSDCVTSEGSGLAWIITPCSDGSLGLRLS